MLHLGKKWFLEFLGVNHFTLVEPKVYDQVAPNTSLVFCPGTKYTSKAQPASCSMQNETITKDHIFFILKKKKVNIGFFFLIVG